MAEIKRDTSVRHLMVPLCPFLEMDGVTEVCVNRPDEVFYEQRGVWHRADVDFDYAKANSLAKAVAKYANSDVSETRPVLSAELPARERAQFVLPPACEAGTVSITLRKPGHQTRPLSQYSEEGFFDKIRPVSGELTPGEQKLLTLKASGQYLDFLKEAVAQGKVIVIAGGTGSGKTTFMKALMQLIPPRLRIVTIEDTAELFLPHHPNHVHLFYPSEGGDAGAVVTSASLLRSCLRMKPDRILLAELRGAEAFDFINVCSSGHEGSITSAHAGSADLTFERLALMVMQNAYGRQLPYEVVRRLLYLTVDVVLHVHNDAEEAFGRHITELWYEPMRKREPASAGAGVSLEGLIELQGSLLRLQERVAELEQQARER